VRGSSAATTDGFRRGGFLGAAPIGCDSPSEDAALPRTRHAVYRQTQSSNHNSLLAGELFGVRALGEIFGLLGLAATIGGAIGGTGAGVLFDRAGSYDDVFAICVGLSWLGAILILFVRPTPRVAPAIDAP